jgi:Tn3 transposase DDE domain
MERYATVRPFIALLGDVVPWGATEAGAPVIAALEALPTVVARRKPAPAHIDARLLTDGTWKRLVLGNPELAPAGLIDKSAWTFCVLDTLHTALKRRDVFALGADVWGDPRARLLAGPEWSAAREKVTAGLDLPGSAQEHLGELRLLLDETFRHVAEALPDNASAPVRDGRLRVDRLDAEIEPTGMKSVRDAVDAMMPKVDYPELLLEVHAHTGVFDAFEHISGMAARRADLEISLTALLVSKSTNIGLDPVVKPGEDALTRGRLVGVDYGHFTSPASLPPPPCS